MNNKREHIVKIILEPEFEDEDEAISNLLSQVMVKEWSYVERK